MYTVLMLVIHALLCLRMGVEMLKIYHGITNLVMKEKDLESKKEDAEFTKAVIKLVVLVERLFLDL